MEDLCKGCVNSIILKNKLVTFCTSLLEFEPQELFKNEYCPCRKCIVKASCIQRKNDTFKCKLFMEKFQLYTTRVEKDKEKITTKKGRKGDQSKNRDKSKNYE